MEVKLLVQSHTVRRNPGFAFYTKVLSDSKTEIFNH